MRQNKKLIFFLLLILCLILTGCGKFSTPGSKDKIAVITKSTKSAFWKTVFAGVNAAATEYNLEVSVQGPETEEDFETQNEMIRQAVADGAGAIVLSAVDYHANAEAVDEAAGQGIKIIVIDSDVDSQSVEVRIGTDNYEAGRMAGKAALDSGEQALYVGIVNYDINTANGQQREQGFRDVMLIDKRVREVTTINVLSTTEDALDGTVDLLKDHPEINVVVTFNEWTSLGVGWAIRKLEKADDTMVIAFDSNVISVGMLETGEVDALVVQNPYAMGYLGIESAYRLLNKTKVAEASVNTATTLITRENMYDADCQKILFSF